MDGLYTVKQFVGEQRIFTEASIRNMIFLRDKNGLEQSGALKRYGRKILIDKEKFFKWIESRPINDYHQKSEQV